MNKLAFALAVRDITRRMNKLAKADNYGGKKLSGVPAAAKDIVDMDSLGGGLADSLGAATFGGDRAGRSKSMAAAAGRDPSFGVKHPAIQTLGYTTAGGLAGALAGTAAGGHIGRAMASPLNRNSLTAVGATSGGTVGSVAGMFLGLLAASASRRKDMRATNAEYDDARSQGRLNPKAPELSVLSAALLPLRGAHRRGQMQGHYMASGEDEKPLNTSTKLKYIAEHMPYIGLPASIVGGYGQNIATQLESRAARSKKTSQLHRDGQQIKTAAGGFGRILRSLFRAKRKSPLPVAPQTAPRMQPARPRLTDNRRQLTVPQAQQQQPRLTDNRRQLAVPQQQPRLTDNRRQLAVPQQQPRLTDNRRQLAVPQQQPRLTDNRRQLAVPQQQPTRYPMSGPLGPVIDVNARRSGVGGGSAADVAADVAGGGARSGIFRSGMRGVAGARTRRSMLDAARRAFTTASPYVTGAVAGDLVEGMFSGGPGLSPSGPGVNSGGPAAVPPPAPASSPAGVTQTALPAASAQPYGRVTSFSQLPADFQQRYRSRNAFGLNVGYNDQLAVDAFNRLYAGTTKQLAAPSGAGQRAYTQAALKRRGGVRATPPAGNLAGTPMVAGLPQ